MFDEGSRQNVRGRLFLVFEVLMLMGLAVSFTSGFDNGILGIIKTQVARNSESFALTFLVTVELHVRSSRITRIQTGIWWGFLGIAYLVTEIAEDLPAEVVTLKESFLGALAISVFFNLIQPDRPSWRRRWWAPTIAMALVVLGELPIAALTGFSTWIVSNAEAWGFLVLTAILVSYIASFPWPEVRPSLTRRLTWIASIILLPLVVAAINPNGVDSVAAVGPFESMMVWIQRITESFVAAVLLTALLWTLEDRRGSAEAEVAQAS